MTYYPCAGCRFTAERHKIILIAILVVWTVEVQLTNSLQQPNLESYVTMLPQKNRAQLGIEFARFPLMVENHCVELQALLYTYTKPGYARTMVENAWNNCKHYRDKVFMPVLELLRRHITYFRFSKRSTDAAEIPSETDVKTLQLEEDVPYEAVSLAEFWSSWLLLLVQSAIEYQSNDSAYNNVWKIGKRVNGISKVVNQLHKQQNNNNKLTKETILSFREVIGTMNQTIDQTHETLNSISKLQKNSLFV